MQFVCKSKSGKICTINTRILYVIQAVCNNIVYVKFYTCILCVNVLIFLSRVVFVFLLFLGMVRYANEVETKEK